MLYVNAMLMPPRTTGQLGGQEGARQSQSGSLVRNGVADCNESDALECLFDRYDRAHAKPKSAHPAQAPQPAHTGKPAKPSVASARIRRATCSRL